MEALCQYFQETLPEELSALSSKYIKIWTDGEILTAPSQILLGKQEDESLKDVELQDFPTWADFIRHRLRILLRDANDDAVHLLFLAGISSMNAFVQSNITGPPLEFSPAKILFPENISADTGLLKQTRAALIQSLSVDGEAAYKLIPNVELFCFAKEILTSDVIIQRIKAATWARIRINSLHQHLLSENSSSLETLIFKDFDLLNIILPSVSKPLPADILASYTLEKTAIQLQYFREKQAQQSLDEATKLRRFDFALTGIMGKRTKFQIEDMSQLVVLAKSVDEDTSGSNSNTDETPAINPAPKTVDLNDDTLLESISFAPSLSSDIKAVDTLSANLRSLDPEKQPQLNPLDSIILLSMATSVTNTSPADGLTREQTAPYAERVIAGKSPNWQIYTQALLVRSRIEGYRSRTVERGLLQLQALVDQVIASTTDLQNEVPAEAPTTFLPQAKPEESASAEERLRYVYLLNAPPRWALEAELAARWVTLGGLKTALEIYSRLEMWAEVALCWAATERDDKARLIVRRQLYQASGDKPDAEGDSNDAEAWTGPERTQLPPDAPRLLCILGDLEKSPALYERAWIVSNSRYFRAQKSLGKWHYSLKDYVKASQAFYKAIKIRQQDHGTWFALGCALLELEKFKQAAEVFSRCVQLDDQDAESWSNLAVALLHIEEDIPTASVASTDPADDEELAPTDIIAAPKPNHRAEALRALKHAAQLKRDSPRIWENLLTIAASLSPPSYSDIINAQRRLIELRGPKDGEACIDVKILGALIGHVTSGKADGGTMRMTLALVDNSVQPLITGSAELWLLVAALAGWREQPGKAMDAEEKAWRVTTNQPAWEDSTEAQWDGVVKATDRLVGAYKELGPKERTDGLAAGLGELVRKDWAFKARSAVRSVMGKAKGRWEGSAGWEKLLEVTQELKSGST
jgi:tetratricopeptide (TPR) repeat protein